MYSDSRAERERERVRDFSVVRTACVCSCVYVGVCVREARSVRPCPLYARQSVVVMPCQSVSRAVRLCPVWTLPYGQFLVQSASETYRQ